jgi:hypothetical protein
MKKQYLPVLYLVFISLLLGSTILFSKPSDKREYVKFADDNRNTISYVAINGSNSMNGYGNSILKKEAVEVSNNSSDICLQANVIEDMSGQVSLNLKYRENGKDISKIIYTSELPEIRNMFRFRAKDGNGFKVGNMFYNKYGKKLYFCIEGRKKKKYTYTAVYSYEMKSSKAENVIHYLGNFGSFHISPDGRYIEFSYVSCPQEILRNEKSTVVILRCSDNRQVLNSDNDDKGNKSGIYSYAFLGWKNNNICELKQTIRSKDGSKQSRNRTMQFDIKTASFIK